MYQKIKRNDLIERAWKEEKIGERILPKEQILSQITTPNSLQERILELNENFNLTNFLMGKTDIETAIGLITPNQILFVECELVDTDNHAYNFQVLYDAIYNPSKVIIPIKNTSTWQEIVIEDSNIVIQLTKFGDLYIWCPETINEHQLSSLRKMNEELKLIQEIYPDILSHLFLDIHAWIGREDGKEVSIEINQVSLDNLLDYYEKHISLSFHK